MNTDIHRILSLLFFCLLLPVPARAVDSPPDILMIAVDDLRPMLGCYGDKRILTPNIDRLAARGVLFERAYCQYAKCGTSRLSLMTGLRPDAIGVFSNSERDVEKFRMRRPDAVSMARWLKEQGYHTQSFGKIYHDGWDDPADWSRPSFPGRPGEMWEVADEKDPRNPTRIAERLDCPVMQSPDVSDDHFFAGRMTTGVLETLEKQPSDKPRFLAVGYRRPHLPFIAPKKYYDRIQPEMSWLAENSAPAEGSPVMAWFNSAGYAGTARRQGFPMPASPGRAEATEWNGYEMRSYTGVPNHGAISPALQLELLHAYAACVTYVDAQIGRLLDALEESNRLENTVVVFWSDHGWHLGEQSAWGKMTNFEIATRVPLIITGPGIPAARATAPAELVDLYPTLCELAGVPAPAHLQGESLVSVLGQPALERDTIALSQYARFKEKNMGRALRTRRYRFVRWTVEKTGEVVARELYDHAVDPLETRNVADDPNQADVVRRLESRLEKEWR